MEQKAVAEVGSICFSKVLPEKKKNWNMKWALNWQLSKKNVFLKVDFRVYRKEKYVGRNLG